MSTPTHRTRRRAQTRRRPSAGSKTPAPPGVAPSTTRRNVPAARRAVVDLLSALGCTLTGELVGTPARVARLWSDFLLAGEGINPASVLGRGSPAPSAAPITLLNVGVHLVCPHHLTVAFGLAHVGYIPRRRVAGFGALARLIHVCSARLVLQEDASHAIARALVEHLDAAAAVAVIDATHPCHNVPHGRSHRAHAVTWGQAGTRGGADELRRLLRTALCPQQPR